MTKCAVLRILTQFLRLRVKDTSVSKEMQLNKNPADEMLQNPLLISMLNNGMNNKDSIIKALSIYILNQLVRSMIDAKNTQNYDLLKLDF
jgi:hypothetical protein